MSLRAVPFETRLVSRGDTKQIAQIVKCSEPGCEAEAHVFASTNNKTLPPSIFNRKVTQQGWEIIGVKAWCPEHHRTTHHQRKTPYLVEKPEPPKPQEKTMPAPDRSLASLGAKDAVERLLTPEFKRKINREIFGNWDEERGRYMGNTTDQIISTQLGVPRAWVEQVRVELYGEDGGNEEIEDLKETLDRYIAQWSTVVADASKQVQSAIDKVSGMETMLSDLKAMRKRLERVEVATLPRR